MNIDITKKTYIRNRTLMTIMIRGFLENESCYIFIDYEIDTKIRRTPHLLKPSLWCHYETGS
jgi:hypothetical protein